MSDIQEPYVKVSEVIKATPNLLNTTGTSSIGVVIVSPVGPNLAYIQGPADFLSKYTIDGETIPRSADISFINAYYLSFTSSLVVARSVNTKLTQGVVFYPSTTTVLPTPTLFRNGQCMIYESSLSITDDTKDWALAFPSLDTVYSNKSFTDLSAAYEKDADALKIISTYKSYTNYLVKKSFDLVSYDPTEEVDSLNEMSDFSSLYSTDTKTITLLSPSITGFDWTQSVNITAGGNYITTDSSYNANLENRLFAIYSEVPQVSKIYKTNVKAASVENEKSPYNFELTYEDTTSSDGTQTFLVSLDPNGVDNDGVNDFIDNLNTSDVGFKVIEFKTGANLTPKGTDTDVPYGESGLDLSACKESTYLNKALTELDEQVLYDIDYLAACGLTDAAFIKNFTTVGLSHKWFTPVDIPYDYSNISVIKNYFKGVANSSNTMALGPFDKNSTLTGWNNYIAASTLYYERVMTNKSAGEEFAPVFDETWGVVQMTNPVLTLGKSQRESLLSAAMPIDFVAYNQRTELYYLNDNRTHQSKFDVMSEDQNRRLINKIQRDLVKIMKQFKAQYNTSSTRSSVIKIIDYYFSSNIMNHIYKPDEYETTCDESNNPSSVITANKLAVTVKVRLYNAIKFIEVLNEVYPLGVDFNS
jgi:hypothetical protein